MENPTRVSINEIQRAQQLLNSQQQYPPKVVKVVFDDPRSALGCTIHCEGGQTRTAMGLCARLIKGNQ